MVRRRARALQMLSLSAVCCRAAPTPRHHPRRRPRWHDTSIRNPNAPTPTIANLAGLLVGHTRSGSARRRPLFPQRPLAACDHDGATGGDHTRTFVATTTIAEKLTSVGYACHFFIGKPCIDQTTDHLPANRGFGRTSATSSVPRSTSTAASPEAARSADPSTGAHDFGRIDAPATSGGAARRVQRRLLRRQGGLADRGAPAALPLPCAPERPRAVGHGRFATIRRWAPSFACTQTCSRCSTTRWPT